ncbi:MAG TPA: hypothetical protein VL981_06455 [Candidatus Methylacidiphilales bacterium]|nr:hypothetical protein [Candidatus Methylacidiphilales bacterium]
MSITRWIVIIIAVVVVLFIVAIAAGTMWLNSFIHSPAFLSEVEVRAGQSLGGTVQIKSIGFDVFRGVKLQGLVTQIDLSHTGGKGTLAANVATLDCGYDWTRLFAGQLKLTGVSLDHPQIVLTQQPPGSFPLPGSSAPEQTSSTPSGPTPGASAVSGPPLSFQFVLDRARISDGTFSLRDSGGASMVELQGINTVADTSGYTLGKDVTGTLKIATASFPPGLAVTDFSTPFSYRPGEISAKSISASAFGGNLAGDYSFVVFSGPSILNLNGKGIDVAKLQAAFSPGSSSPALTGSLDVQSKWRAVEQGAVDGEGDLQLASGQLHGIRILNDIGGLLKINELTDPVISRGQTHFQVANRQTQLTALQLISNGFKITGGGTVGFDGQLNLDLVLTLAQSAMGRLPQPVAASFVTQTDGSGTIGFKVFGTESNPQTDLPQRLLMQNTQIKNVINKALNKLFH